MDLLSLIRRGNPNDTARMIFETLYGAGRELGGEKTKEETCPGSEWAGSACREPIPRAPFRGVRERARLIGDFPDVVGKEVGLVFSNLKRRMDRVLRRGDIREAWLASILEQVGIGPSGRLPDAPDLDWSAPHLEHILGKNHEGSDTLDMSLSDQHQINRCLGSEAWPSLSQFRGAGRHQPGGLLDGIWALPH